MQNAARPTVHDSAPIESTRGDPRSRVRGRVMPSWCSILARADSLGSHSPSNLEPRFYDGSATSSVGQFGPDGCTTFDQRADHRRGASNTGYGDRTPSSRTGRTFSNRTGPATRLRTQDVLVSPRTAAGFAARRFERWMSPNPRSRVMTRRRSAVAASDAVGSSAPVKPSSSTESTSCPLQRGLVGRGLGDSRRA